MSSINEQFISTGTFPWWSLCQKPLVVATATAWLPAYCSIHGHASCLSLLSDSLQTAGACSFPVPTNSRQSNCYLLYFPFYLAFTLFIIYITANSPPPRSFSFLKDSLCPFIHLFLTAQFSFFASPLPVWELLASYSLLHCICQCYLFPYCGALSLLVNFWSLWRVVLRVSSISEFFQIVFLLTALSPSREPCFTWAPSVFLIFTYLFVFIAA